MNQKAKYSFIENDIIEKITQNIYQSDMQLPTEEELRKQYGCSRVTVRRALSDLQYMGYIYSRQGSGSFVSSKQKLQSPDKVSSLNEFFRDRDIETKNEVIRFEIRKADKAVSEFLGISHGSKVYYIERLRYADRHPIILESKYMSVDMHPYLSYESLIGSIFNEAEKHGLIIKNEKCTVIPVFPDQSTADMLQISDKKPILKVIVTAITKNEEIFSYGEEYYNPDYYQFSFVFEK